jgi:hypothetical protein
LFPNKEENIFGSIYVFAVADIFFNIKGQENYGDVFVIVVEDVFENGKKVH